MALTMMRILQYKMKAIIPAEDTANLNWSYGLPGNRLADTLRSWQVDELPGSLYRMHNADTDDLLLILKGLGLALPLKLFSRGDLRALKAAVQIF